MSKIEDRLMQTTHNLDLSANTFGGKDNSDTSTFTGGKGTDRSSGDGVGEGVGEGLISFEFRGGGGGGGARFAETFKSDDEDDVLR